MGKGSQIETCFEHFTRQLREGWRCISLSYPFVLLAAPNSKGVTKLLDLSNDVETLRPNAAGDLTQFTFQYPASGAHWDKVDESTPDDSTTYTGTTANLSQLTDIYNLPAHSGTGPISSVVVYVRAKEGIYAWANLRIMTKTHGVLYQSSVISLDNNWTTYSTTYTNNPNTSSAWTWAEIDALQIGAKIWDEDEWGDVIVTQVYAEVNYNPILYLAGVIAATSSITGSLTKYRPLTGIISASSSVSGALGLQKPLAGAIAASTSVAGSLTKHRALAGVVGAASSVAGSLIVTKELVGIIASTSTVVGASTFGYGLSSYTPLYTESFETNFGDWVSSGDLGWTRRNTPTPTANSGPDSAYDGNWYIYTEASDGGLGYPYKVSYLTYNETLNSFKHVNFWYHKYGIDCGPLELHAYYGGAWHTVWSRPAGDEGNTWFNAIVDFPDGTTNIRFKSTTGDFAYGDTALDLITIYSGIDVLSTVTGALSILMSLAGVIGATSTVSGLIGLPRALAGTINAQSTITGPLSLELSLAGVIAATLTVTGTIGVERGLTGIIPVTSSVAGAIIRDLSLKGIVASNTTVVGALTRLKLMEGVVAVASTVEGALNVARPLAGVIGAVSEVTGKLGFAAATRGFYYAKLGTENLHNPPKTSFSITTELNNIASFDYEIQNDAHNRSRINWTHKREITISPTTPENNYPIKIELTTSNFDYSKANDDGSDIRFYGTDCGKELQYWIATWNASGTSEIWVSIPNLGTSIIYMRYGNANAVSESNNENMFEMLDVQGIVNFWHMDEAVWTGAAGEVIDETGTNHGVAGGGVTTTAGGKFNRAGDFDGTGDYVNCGNAGNGNYNAMTIEAWIKVPSYVPSTWRTPLHRNDTTSVGTSVFFIGLRTGGHQIVATIGAGSGAGYMAGNTTVVAFLDTWYHIVNTWNGTTARVYVNGIEKKNYALSSDDFSNKTAVTRIGASGNGTGYLFHGIVDEARIYDRAFSPGEITTLHENYMEKMGSIFNVRKCSASEPITSIGSELDCGITEDFSVMRDDGTELLRASIDSDSIEYYTESEGRGRGRIRLSGFANFVDLKYLIYKRMAAGDAENVGSVQDEDNSTSTFTDYTTAANNATINDVILTFGAVNDALYIGKDETFFATKIKYSTKGIQAANTTVVMEYSKGSGIWATLDCIDESYSFTEDAGTYLLYIPNKADDWAKDTVNGKNQYHIRFRITQGSYSTLPKLDQIKLSNADVCRVQFNDTPADTILTYLLEGTGYTEDATDQCPSTEITIRGEYDSKLRWIFGLGSALAWEDANGDMQRYDCWIDTAKKVHYKQRRGTDQGDISADFRALRNKMGYEEMGTRIFGTGGQEGINQKKAVVEDLTAQNAHKLREIVLEDNRITTYEAVKEEALKSLANRKNPLKDVSGDLDTKYWLDRTMDVGDKILVHQPDWNLNNQELYIMRAVIGPSATKLDLGNSQIHLEHLRSTLQRQMDIGNVWMHGSVSTYVIGPEEENFERENDTTVHPVRMTIEVPSNARGINHVEISWTLSNFLSSVKGSENLPAHDHTIADSGNEGAHDHTIGASVAAGAHDHTIGASVAAGAHDHSTSNEGDHFHVITSAGDHWHTVDGTITTQSATAITSVGMSVAGGHTHTNPTTSGPSGTTSVIQDIGYGTACTSGNCITGSDPCSVASPGHTHTQGGTGSDGVHHHPLGGTEAYFIYNIPNITGWTTSQHNGHAHPESTEPVHDHGVTIEVAHAHTNPNSGTKPAHQHTNPNSGTKPAHRHTVPNTSSAPGGAVTLQYGMYNAASGDALELLINDEKVGDFIGSQTGINITGWITTGHNSVELQPKVTDNVKGRASISAIATVFLENLK